jgi:class 3 adenylate cyclase
MTRLYHAGARRGEGARGVVPSPGVRAFLREFLTGIGAPPAAARRLRIAAWARLLLIVPAIVLPTGLTLWAFLPSASGPVTATRLAVAWTALAALLVAVNVAILALDADRGPRRAAAARLLTFVSLTAEIGTNQIGTHAIGTLTSHGGVYLILIVAIYRVFFDYRLGLYAALVGAGGFALSAALGFTGVVPAASLLPAFDHVLHHDAGAAFFVTQVVIAGILLAFFAVNYGVNQAVKLHRYITESVLRRYLPPALVERASRGELRMDAEPERRIVTVLFADLVGFTAMAERRDPDEVGRILNRFLSRMADVAHARGATVDKFVGDAVMIVLGAPDELPPEEQARRCVALAREMLRELGAMAGDLPLRLRVGINTGEAVVGHFGSEARSDFTVLGHAVNVAARLEAAAAPGRILLGEETARLLGDSVPLEPAGELTLKNVSRPVRAFHVADAEAPPLQESA